MVVKHSEQFSVAPDDVRKLELILIKTSGACLDALQARERRWMLYVWLAWVASVAGLCGLVVFGTDYLVP